MSAHVVVNTLWMKKSWVPIWLMRLLCVPNNEWYIWYKGKGGMAYAESTDGINWYRKTPIGTDK